MLEVQERGVYKVIDADQLHAYTAIGWRLVTVLENETPISFMEQTPLQNVTVTSNWSVEQPHIQTTKWLSTKRPSFLVVQDEESKLAEMQGQLVFAQNRLDKEIKDFSDFKALVANDALEYERLKHDHRANTDAYLRLDKDFWAYKAKTEAELKAGEKMLQEAALAIEKYGNIRKTAYERILEGEFDERIEDIEAGDFGNGRESVADVPQEPGIHAK